MNRIGERFPSVAPAVRSLWIVPELLLQVLHLQPDLLIRLAVTSWPKAVIRDGTRRHRGPDCHGSMTFRAAPDWLQTHRLDVLR